MARIMVLNDGSYTFCCTYICEMYDSDRYWYKHKQIVVLIYGNINDSENMYWHLLCVMAVLTKSWSR